MKQARGMILLAAIAAVLLAPGCGTIGEVMLGALKNAAKEAIQTATSQAVEKAASEVESQLQQSVIQNVSGAITPG
jgi:hypothetical protein